MRLADPPVTVRDSFSPFFFSGLACGFGRVRASAASTAAVRSSG